MPGTVLQKPMTQNLILSVSWLKLPASPWRAWASNLMPQEPEFMYDELRLFLFVDKLEVD